MSGCSGFRARAWLKSFIAFECFPLLCISIAACRAPKASRTFAEINNKIVSGI
jgi:hypothetical protein